MWVLLSCIVAHQITMDVRACSVLTQCCIRELLMRVWGRSYPVESLIQLQTTQRMSPVVEQLLDIQNVHIWPEFSSLRISTHKWLIEKNTAMRVWRHKSANRISHLALTQKIDISDSRAVIQYVKRPYTTRIEKREVVMRAWIHNSLIVSHIQL